MDSRGLTPRFKLPLTAVARTLAWSLLVGTAMAVSPWLALCLLLSVMALALLLSRL